MFFPGLIFLFVWFIPESPRWLYVNNQRDKAIDTLTKWHGYGNPESAWVTLQTHEYEEFLNMNGAVSLWSFTADVPKPSLIIRRTSDSGTTVPSSAAAPSKSSFAAVSTEFRILMLSQVVIGSLSTELSPHSDSWLAMRVSSFLTRLIFSC